jgi:DNA-binding IclR family transcriptional regulator
VQGAKTVDQALSVLLALEDRPRTASDLAETTGLNRTVVHRMLATLHERGFVRREADLYSPGAVFVRFANTVEPALRTASRVPMSQLSDASGETIVLSVPDHLDAVAIEQLPGRRHPLRVEYDLGSRRPMVKGASGRVILAFLAEDVIARALRTTTDPDELRARLEQARSEGFAVSRNELQTGVHGIAVPVSTGGRVVASLSLILPEQRGDSLLEYLDALLRASKEISANLDGGH